MPSRLGTFSDRTFASRPYVRASVIVAVVVCTPPLWEQVRLCHRTLHRECQEEYHKIGSGIERCGVTVSIQADVEQYR